jgi:glutamate racemase
MDTRPIGVFDSGFGGLTVLQELVNSLPKEDFIYFGDTLRVPYGNKTVEEIETYSSQISKWLVQHDVKSIVVACNTVSCMALPYLQRQFSIPFFGMVSAGIESVLSFSSAPKQSNKVGIIGTKNTIASRVHEKDLRMAGFEGVLVELACPLFVPIIEEGVTDDGVWRSIVEYHMHDMKKENIDAVLLACTHYPILSEYIQGYLGNQVQLLNPNHFISDALARYLKDYNLQNATGGSVSLNVTGSTLSFNAFCHRFFEFRNDTVSVINIDSLI